MKTTIIAAVAVCFVWHTGTSAQTSVPATGNQEERALRVTIGLRAFVNKVSGQGYIPSGMAGVNPIASNASTGYETSFLPSLGVRYKRFVFSGNYHASTDYGMPIPEEVFDVEFARKEWDASLGYEIAGGVVLSLGWKEFKISGPLIQDQEYSGPFLGIAASAPLAGGWSIYGTFAYGRLDLELDGREVGRSGDYFSSEIGLLYPLGDLSPSLERVSLQLGYRTQSARTKDVPVSVPSATGGLVNTTRSTRDGLDGLTIGVTISF